MDAYSMTCVGFDVLHHPGTHAFTWPDFTYEYDRVGNISKMVTSSSVGIDTQSFNYDHLNRLWKAVATGGVANYTHNTANTDFEYDRLGNITYFGSLTQYDYTTRHSGCGSQPAHAQPHAVKQIDSNYYCYDANGNMTRRVEGGVTYQQSFNVENELTSVVVSGQTTSFTYDAAGIRVKTVKPNGVVIDHPFPTYEVENPTATTPIRRSTYSIAGQTIATRVSGDPVSGNNGISYFYNDHLGSNTALRKPDGSRVSTYYLPFGNYRGAAPSQTITDRDFTGQPQNRAVGLLYYQARFYVPGIGRFASADSIIPDPANPQQYNRYTYTLNNPLRFADPTGHLTVDEIHNYFGYDDKTSMIEDGWDAELVDLLFSDDFTWSDVFSFNYKGEQVEAMLILLADGNNTTFRGMFWGMSGPLRGVGIWGNSIQGDINRYTDEATMIENQFKYGYTYLDIPIADGWYFMVPNAHVEFGMAGMGRVMTYAGGGVLVATFAYWTAGLITPTALTWASAATTAIGTAMQLAVDTGYVEETKLYFIMTYFEPLSDQYNWGFAKPIGQFE